LQAREKLGDAPETAAESWFFVHSSRPEQTTVKKYTPLPLTRLGNFKAYSQSTVFSSHWRGILCYLAGHPIVMGREGLKFSFTTPDGLVAR